MDMIWACLGFYDFHPFLFTQLPKYLSDISPDLTVYYHPAIFWRKCNGIFNHTDLYEYKHGKMLMHLKFCFESIPNEPTPATMLRYYRQRKGLTTRQLAESVGIVPATVLKYESKQFPIPYPTAVAFADILGIDSSLLFDEFARFMDYPFSVKLREVRKTYGLNQTAFAEKANICYGIYTKWETAVRQPSRKMYEQLVTTYPEIKI